MRRSCERPGCGQPVAVIYGQEPATAPEEGPQQFWLDAWSPDLAETDPPLGARGVLCAGHGEQLVPPRGWTLVDRRDAVPRLFKPRLVTESALRESKVDREAISRRLDRTEALQRRMSDVPRPQLFNDWIDDDERQSAPTSVDASSNSNGEGRDDHILGSQIAGSDQKSGHQDQDLEIDGLMNASGSLLQDAFRRAGGGKRDATNELLRPTSVPTTTIASVESDNQ